jgi:hypothetical protein
LVWAGDQVDVAPSKASKRVLIMALLGFAVLAPLTDRFHIRRVISVIVLAGTVAIFLSLSPHFCSAPA